MLNIKSTERNALVFAWARTAKAIMDEVLGFIGMKKKTAHRKNVRGAVGDIRDDKPASLSVQTFFY